MTREAAEIIDKIVSIVDVLLFLALVFLIGFILGGMYT